MDKVRYGEKGPDLRRDPTCGCRQRCAGNSIAKRLEGSRQSSPKEKDTSLSLRSATQTQITMINMEHVGLSWIYFDRSKINENTEHTSHQAIAEGGLSMWVLNAQPYGTATNDI